MAPPLYFFARLTLGDLVADGRYNRETLRRYELDGVLRDVIRHPQDAAVFELVSAGPGGHSGTLLTALPADRDAPPRIGFFPQFQTWTEHATRDRPLWVGIDREHPPEPADLARRVQIEGYELDLGGRLWSLPVLRDPDGKTALPERVEMDPDGSVRCAVRTAYADLYGRWADVVGWYFDPECGVPAFDAEKVARAIDLIGVNYRFGRIENNLLDLVDKQSWMQILACSVDLSGFRDVFLACNDERQKKTLPPSGGTGESTESPAADPASCASIGTAAGSEGCCPNTGPASESCTPPPSESAPTSPSSNKSTLPDT